MSDNSALVGEPISRNTSFNWTWFVELATASCLTLFFLFYFNRLFATLVSYGIRAWTWHKYRAWIDIQALQLSFLAGRVFFKGVRYHAENETVLIQSGYITWRYWQSSSRQVDLSDSSEHEQNPIQTEKKRSPADGSDEPQPPLTDPESGRVRKKDTADARISIFISGLEWFVYNRTPVYESIVQDVLVHEVRHGSSDSPATEQQHEHKMPKLRHRKDATRPHSKDAPSSDISADSPLGEKHEQQSPFDEFQVPVVRAGTFTSVASGVDVPTADVPSFYSWILRVLPVAVECSKGAISLGNENTRALVVTTFASAKGHIDAAAAGPADYFRQVFDFEIEKPKVEMRPNPDFRRSQFAAAERIILAAESLRHRPRWWHVHLDVRRRLVRTFRRLRRLLPGSSRGSLRTTASQEDYDKKLYAYDEFQDDNRSWHGLGRYMDEDERDDHEGWSHIDYARFSQILDCPAVHFKFFWDMAGKVLQEHAELAAQTNIDDINMSKPPSYGMDLVVKGGYVNYGPWSDRLRLELQTAFFPNPYRTMTPASPVKPGEARQYTMMTIRVHLEDEVSLRVPTRERSKDWQWRNGAHAVREAAAARKQREKRHFRFRRSAKTKLGPDVRPFGWLTVSAGQDSTVRYDMDMLPRAEGYRNHLHLDLKNTKATSSVNHALLWRCPSQKVSCDLSNPLVWNGLHSWGFDVESNAMEMFILRDHMIMLTDLVSDFTAGQKSDYMTFVPFIYRLHLTFPEMKLFLNANDYNIIDSPNDLEENAFLILGFQTLAGDVDIPMQYFSPRQSSVQFIGEGHNASLELVTPVWNTLNTLAENTTMMTLKQLNLEGSYNYYPNVSPKLTDSLFMTITGYAPKFFLHGYLIRYFMNVKENYFGEDLHFRTLEEYQDMLAGNEPQGPRPGTKKDNDLDVILTVRADSAAVLMPGNIYSRRENLRVDILLVEADMRFTNYYMDLQVSSSPLEASIESISLKHNQPRSDITNCQLFIEGVGIYGHRLFGSPPLEPTYACHWDINVGEVTGECTSKFVQTLLNAVMAFIYTLDDAENSLPPLNRTPVHDVTFLRANLAGLRVWLVAGAAAYMIGLSETDVSFSDWANSSFAKKLRASVPKIEVAAVDYKCALRHHERKSGPVETYGCFETSLRIGTLDKTDDLAHTRALQQQHIRYHDQRTHRADWLLDSRKHYPPNHKIPEWARDPPAMPIPAMPEPLGTPEKTSFPEPVDRFGRKRSNRNSSFVSVPSLRKSSDSYVQHQPRPNPDTSWRPLSERPATNERTNERHRLDHLHVQHGDAHNALVTFSSPWTPPHFTLQEVQPEKKHMPQLLDPRRNDFASLTAQESEHPENEGDEFEGTPHNGVIFMVQNGLTGFCSPALFLSIGELITELIADHPVDQLDKMQMTVMKRILETYKHDDQGHIVDFAVQVPFAHIRFVNSLTQDGGIRPSNDQYDVKLTGTQMMYRLSHPKTARPGISTPHSQLAYGSIQNFSVSVRDDAFASGQPSAHAAVSLARVGFWFSMKEEVNSRLQLSNFDVVLWAEQLNSMAALIQRTVAMVDRIIGAFKSLDQSFKSRHLIYHLTQAGSAIADPVFLTRPSYVLRSADKHVRLSDSWKIISRLRYIFATVEKDKGREFVEKCGCPDLELKDLDKRQVLSSFEQWRGWDHARDKVPFMITLFETPGSRTPEASHNSLVVHSEIVVGKLGVILDPGPRQSDFAILGLDFNIILQRGQDSGVSSNTQRVILQAYTADTSLHLNWALVELARQLIELGDPLALSPPRNDAPVAHSKEPLSATRNHFTVVVGTDAASIHLTTINLKLKWAAESFRSAFSFSEGSSGPAVSSFTIAANTAMAKFRGPTRTLMLWRIRMPKLYGSIWPQAENHFENQKVIVQICAASNRLRFQMKEELVKMLVVADSVVRDEVATIIRLIDEIPKSQNNHETVKSTNPPGLDLNVDLRVAMFLDDYRLNFAILPSLQYAIAGNAARTSIVPRRDGGLDINLDIKEHEHLFEVSQGRSMDNLPLLTMPPINGHISVVPAASLISLRARMTVEQINLEASGVRACFDALNQPGVVQLIPDAKHAIQQIQSSVDRALGSRSKPRQLKKEDAALLLRYAIHGTLAGVKIHFSAPSIREDQDYRADMELKLRGTTLLLHNEMDNPASIQERPQFTLSTQGLGLGLYRITSHTRESFGTISVGMKASGKTETLGNAGKVQVYRAWSDGLTVELYEETATLAVDIIAFLQDRIKLMKLADRESNIHHIRRLTTAGLTDRLKPKEQLSETGSDGGESIDGSSTVLYDSTYALDLGNILLRWNLTSGSGPSSSHETEDLVFSIRKVDLKTRQEGTARLAISDTQLQMVPKSQAETPTARTANSALLPEVVFGTGYLSTKHERRIAFQAKGKALDLRLASDFIIPGHSLQKSFGNASGELRNARAIYETGPAAPLAAPNDLLGGKRLASLLVDADFAGAVVHISPRAEVEHKSSAFGFLKGPKRSRAGRYGQAVQGEDVSSAVLQAPGVALKVEYKDDNKGDPSLSTEVRVAASSNTLYPTVVPLILEISASVKEILGDDQVNTAGSPAPTEARSYLSDTALTNPNPDAIFGRCKLNAGLYIQPQEFSLSCQPIARVAATAKFADIFVRINTVSAPDQERFFAIITTFNKLEASVQHVYSRESTASFEVDSIVMSLMNSKHVSATPGISAILNISPMKTDINAKQLQDFLLFREIWYPPELRSRSKPSTSAASPLDQQAYAMQRYQELSGKGTLPWHAIVSVQELQLVVDLGQGLGKSVFTVSKLWASSRKNSDSEQNLCIGFDRVGIDSTGRMSGFVELENMRLRTSIHWPEDAAAKARAPLVQASIGFEHFRVKAAFDYQPFAVADISFFDFLMYNVRHGQKHDSDRLVGIVNGGKVQVFCTTGTAAQGLALVQAFERLVQEKQEAYKTSLRDLDKFLRRKSVFPSNSWTAPVPARQHREEGVSKKGTFTLHTDVIVTLGALDAGVFPNTFFDNQILKVEATDVQARFAVATTQGKTHSGLGMTLGQLRVALSSVNRATTKALSEVSVPDVVDRATSSRGGTIVKVPRLVSSMQTWQVADSNVIEYTFRSTFEGKVDVGWNYARISFIRGMWQTHSRALAQRLGKPLPPSAIKVTAEPPTASSASGGGGDAGGAGGEKITAVVNVPQSKFTYVALEPPIIDTPQLRDMGEATPPLEWIGLHRDKLPEATHSIAIVSLLEVAREVEDAYTRILGAS